MSFEDKVDYTDFWRWKLLRKMAAFIHQPDSSHSAELLALINQYRTINQRMSPNQPLDSAS